MAISFLALVFEYEPIKYIEFLSENQILMFLWHFTIYIIPGVVLITLALAIYDRLKEETPILAQASLAIGIIWSGLINASGMVLIKDAAFVVDLFAKDPNQAATIWLSLSAVEDALGGGAELAGGHTIAAYNERCRPASDNYRR